MRRFAALTCFVTLLAFPQISPAESFKQGHIAVDHPWARATPGTAPNGAAYMTLTASGQETDSLMAASSPVAQKVELHTHMMKDGVMMMRPVDAIEVVPGSPTVLQPGGLHVMLMGLRAPLKEGGRFPLVLTFEKAGSLEVEVTVQAVGSMAPKEGGHGGGGAHHGHGKTGS